MVQQLLDAAQVKLSPVPRFPDPRQRQARRACSVEDQREGEVLQALASLETDTETALSDLQTLSRAGNAYASYQLGLYYSSHEMEGMDTQQVAQNFFNCAAQLRGYGPGYGALADYALNGRRKSSPGGPSILGIHIPGGPGRQRWSKNAADLLAYREQNVRSGRQFPAAGGGHAGDNAAGGYLQSSQFAMAVPALVLGLAAGVRCVLQGLVMDPYGSYRFVYAALAACWLLNILCLV